MLKLISGLLAGVASIGGLLRGRGRRRYAPVLRGVFRHAVVEDTMLPEEVRDAVRHYARDRHRIVTDRGAAPDFSVPTFNHSGDVDARGFASLDAAVAAVDPETGAPFNARVVADGSLDRASLLAAYAEIRGHDRLCVARVFMNPREYSDVQGIPGLGRLSPVSRELSAHGAAAGVLWGAEVIVSDSVPKGTVYVCADREYVGVMPRGRGGAVGIGIHNPKGVASVTVRRINWF